MNYNNDEAEDRYSRSPYRNRSRSPDQRNTRYYRDQSRSRSRSKSPRRDFNPQFRDRAGSGNYRGNRSPPRRNNNNGPPQMLQQVKDSSQQDRRVYVGNLAYEVKWHHLKDFMRQAGNVLFADVLLMPNGRSKGCGIVEYSTREEAENAVNTLTNQELMGRVVYVREDRESEPKFSQPNLPPGGAREGGRPERAEFGGARQSGGGAPGTQLFVGNLPYSTGWQDLKDLFREAGQIVRADIMTSHDGRSKGSGIVLFETAEDAHRAIERFNGHQMGGRAIEVREDRFAGPPRGGPPPRVARTPFAAAAPQNPPRVPSDFSDNAVGGGDPSDTIFVGNLPWSTADQDLYDLFETVGKVTNAEIQVLPDGKKAGSGVVQFETPASAEISIAKFSGYNYGRRDLELSYVRRNEVRIPDAPAAFHE